MAIYVTYPNNVGVYHIVVLSKADDEDDKTLCGQDLFTRNKEIIWKTLIYDIEFFDTPPQNKRLCKKCQFQKAKAG